MRKKIDQDYIDAVRKACDVLGGQMVLAHHAGIAPGTICALLNPRNDRKYVQSSIYNRLYPFVSPYLPEPPEIPIGPSLPPQIPVMPANPFYSNTINNITAPGNVVPSVAPGAPAAPIAPVELTPGTIPPEVILHGMQGMTQDEKARFMAILHAMQGMTPAEKAQFINELYTNCTHETEESTEE